MEETAVAKRRVVYTPELAFFIIEDYTAGKSLAEIATRPDMPSLAVINKWLHREDAFRKDFEEARALRALMYEGVIDSVMQSADGVEKEEVPAQRLKFDTAAWLAEKNDPARFGKKTTLSGDKDNPIQIIVSTGVPEPTADQRPPELDSSGMIVARTVESVVINEAEEVFDGTGD